MRFLPLLAAATLLYSCDQKQVEQQQINNIQAGSSDSLQLENPNDSAVVAPDATSVIAEPSAVAPSVSAKPALNPEHGQPYHRCDIPVGAPINSAPAAASPVVTQNAPQTNNFNTSPMTPAQSSGTVSGPKPAVNPPHGESHHRCDLQVGAPLT